ncbi:hypothetical protein QWZ08_19335 [Ferruginibacter paludis]|uniref:hypothetical protein n=1 Tax=Ferruginibacter paludis TaxID=1310417 RepID=UPI0025B59ACB|nr:hypothetical protein [Ferruginibacter paludis]MDN3657814.1 hypothetical protein [Ferruginibacter paludis]
MAQTAADSAIDNLNRIPTKYITGIDKKIDRYTNQVTNKTEKTLTKLSRWENKIRTLLQKANPTAAEKLFGNNQLTFTSMLQKLKAGEAVVSQYPTAYDSYRDHLTTNVKYLQDQKSKLNGKLSNVLDSASIKIASLNEEEDRSEALQQIIKERKRQIISECFQYLGNNKYLGKINQETYYYLQTLKNFKELFKDSQKAEQAALTMLNKIPAFQAFVQQNSMLAGLFGAPAASNGSAASIAGLQTSSSVSALIQNQIAAGGPNAMSQITGQLQAAHSELSKLKDKVLKAGGSSSDAEIPDFKADNTKTKTFKQRLEFSVDMQSIGANAYLPAKENIGFNLGFQINEKSSAGIGASYLAGLGTIEHIHLTHQGVGLRSFVDWKLKRQFFLSGGFEMNYNTVFKNLSQLQQYSTWQQSGLAGISKKMPIKNKWFKGTKFQLLYDLLASQHPFNTHPIVFRAGFNF